MKKLTKDRIKVYIFTSLLSLTNISAISYISLCLWAYASLGHGALVVTLLLAISNLLGNISNKLFCLPPLVGMIIGGAFIRFAFGENLVDSAGEKFYSFLRTTAAGVILFRAGFSMEKSFVIKYFGIIASLGIIPAISEALTVACLSILLNLFIIGGGNLWIWSFCLGFMLAPVSPAVIVPRMIELSEFLKDYKMNKNLSSTIDDEIHNKNFICIDLEQNLPNQESTNIRFLDEDISSDSVKSNYKSELNHKNSNFFRQTKYSRYKETNINNSKGWNMKLNNNILTDTNSQVDIKRISENRKMISKSNKNRRDEKNLFNINEFTSFNVDIEKILELQNSNSQLQIKENNSFKNELNVIKYGENKLSKSSFSSRKKSHTLLKDIEGKRNLFKDLVSKLSTTNIDNFNCINYIINSNQKYNKKFEKRKIFCYRIETINKYMIRSFSKYQFGLFRKHNIYTRMNLLNFIDYNLEVNKLILNRLLFFPYRHISKKLRLKKKKLCYTSVKPNFRKVTNLVTSNIINSRKLLLNNIKNLKNINQQFIFASQSDHQNDTRIYDKSSNFGNENIFQSSLNIPPIFTCSYQRINPKTHNSTSVLIPQLVTAAVPIDITIGMLTFHLLVGILSENWNQGNNDIALLVLSTIGSLFVALICAVIISQIYCLVELIFRFLNLLKNRSKLRLQIIENNKKILKINNKLTKNSLPIGNIKNSNTHHNELELNYSESENDRFYLARSDSSFVNITPKRNNYITPDIDSTSDFDTFHKPSLSTKKYFKKKKILKKSHNNNRSKDNKNMAYLSAVRYTGQRLYNVAQDKRLSELRPHEKKLNQENEHPPLDSGWKAAEFIVSDLNNPDRHSDIINRTDIIWHKEEVNFSRCLGLGFFTIGMTLHSYVTSIGYGPAAGVLAVAMSLIWSHLHLRSKLLEDRPLKKKVKKGSIAEKYLNMKESLIVKGWYAQGVHPTICLHTAREVFDHTWKLVFPVLMGSVSANTNFSFFSGAVFWKILIILFCGIISRMTAVLVITSGIYLHILKKGQNLFILIFKKTSKLCSKIIPHIFVENNKESSKDSTVRKSSNIKVIMHKNKLKTKLVKNENSTNKECGTSTTPIFCGDPQPQKHLTDSILDSNKYITSNNESLTYESYNTNLIYNIDDINGIFFSKNKEIFSNDQNLSTSFEFYDRSLSTDSKLSQVPSVSVSPLIVPKNLSVVFQNEYQQNSSYIYDSIKSNSIFRDSVLPQTNYENKSQSSVPDVPINNISNISQSINKEFKFKISERLLMALAWIPKATVQAATAGLVFETATKILGNAQDSPIIHNAEIIYASGTLAIFCSAPLGDILIAIFGKRLLTK